ncbi:PREDICTED: mRNAion factor [Prunus dulcis]|uniref:PREDICTED: mRNAion factor n=1 Tax=Prunus dulcis TaxID=3755 RepID=A0A5E4E5V0_PRUDU|nr:PREDICTED: mRNAion factor [Prunus dulcis]
MIHRQIIAVLSFMNLDNKIYQLFCRFSNNLSRPPQPEKPNDDQWTFDENKRFENALTELNLDAPYLFQKIRTRVPEKTVAQVKNHFEALFEDILMIESGHIAVPEYNKISIESKVTTKPFRRKRTPWTKHEHKLFLKGLEQYGKGDWRSISRFCVVTRTPTQVASHAQKYFLRVNQP